jgi:hypothetical protein
MPVVEGQHNGRQIIVPVFVAAPIAEGSTKIVGGTALIDTGATRSLITTELAVALDLPARGKQPLVSARSTDIVNRYAFRLGFLICGDSASPVPYMMEAELIGSEFRDHGNFNVIVGMDVLNRGDLIVRRNGIFRFGF